MTKDSLPQKLEQLSAAYENSLAEAARLKCQDVAFCLLSCGVFRGNVDLETCIRQGIRGYCGISSKTSSAKDVSSYDLPRGVHRTRASGADDCFTVGRFSSGLATSRLD